MRRLYSVRGSVIQVSLVGMGRKRVMGGAANGEGVEWLLVGGWKVMGDGWGSTRGDGAVRDNALREKAGNQ